MKKKYHIAPFDQLMTALRRRYGHGRYRLMDFNCLGFVAVLGMVLPWFRARVPAWPLYCLVHALVVLAVLEVIRLHRRYPAVRPFAWLRTFYPLLMLSACWWEVGRLVPQMYAELWATDVLLHLDRLLFGVHPTLWMQRFYAPWLDEIANFFYCIYYLYLPVLPVYLYTRGRRREATAVLSIVTLAFCVNFVLFYALPAMGPQFVSWLEAMRTRQPGGYFIAAFTRMIQAHGGNIGGAFPSSHISGAAVWALAMRRYDLRIGAVLLALLPGIAVATVYLGYHHALDPLVGLVLGIAAFRVAVRILKLRGEDPGAAVAPVQRRRQRRLPAGRLWGWGFPAAWKRTPAAELESKMGEEQ